MVFKRPSSPKVRESHRKIRKRPSNPSLVELESVDPNGLLFLQLVRHLPRLNHLPCLHDEAECYFVKNVLGHDYATEDPLYCDYIAGRVDCCLGLVRNIVPGKYYQAIIQMMGPAAAHAVLVGDEMKATRGVLLAIAPHEKRKLRFDSYAAFAEFLDNHKIRRFAFCCFDTCPHYYLGFGDLRTAKRHIFNHLEKTIEQNGTINNSILASFYYANRFICTSCHTVCYHESAKLHPFPCQRHKPFRQRALEPATDIARSPNMPLDTDSSSSGTSTLSDVTVTASHKCDPPVDYNLDPDPIALPVCQCSQSFSVTSDFQYFEFDTPAYPSTYHSKSKAWNNTNRPFSASTVNSMKDSIKDCQHNQYTPKSDSSDYLDHPPVLESQGAPEQAIMSCNSPTVKFEDNPQQAQNTVDENTPLLMLPNQLPPWNSNIFFSNLANANTPIISDPTSWINQEKDTLSQALENAVGELNLDITLSNQTMSYGNIINQMVPDQLDPSSQSYQLSPSLLEFSSQPETYHTISPYQQASPYQVITPDQLQYFSNEQESNKSSQQVEVNVKPGSLDDSFPAFGGLEDFSFSNLPCVAAPK